MTKKGLVPILAVLFLGASEATATDAFLGTWKLNEAKSKLDPAAGKNLTVVYAPQGDGVKVTVDGIDKDGKPAHNEWTGKYDGKDYPVIGDPSSDARSCRKVDDRTLAMTVKKDGKVTYTGKLVVAPDGKSRTLTLNGTSPQGKKISLTAVYDKQ